MRLRIDKRGRIAIPKSLREKLGLILGVTIEAHEEARGLILRAARRNPALLREKGLLVHQGAPSGRVDWQRMIDALRHERHQ
jgi:AbrB family looped-hinge helix DNA binding protein